MAEEAGPVRGWLLRYFRRWSRDEADLEDMVQDVFARMAARDSTAPVEHLGGYLVRVAESVAADRARRGGARGAGLHVALEPQMHGHEHIDPERVLSAKEDLHAATRALLSLPERTRTVFILRRLENQSYRQIAARLGISVSAVEKHMVRAVQHLVEGMGERGDP